MHEILLTKPDDAIIDPFLLKDMFAFRKKIFHDKLNWEVNHQNGLEFDYFDTLQPTYIVSRAKNIGVNGCWRFLPTTGPYMLQNIFPKLLRGEWAPNNKSTWEISRFAVDANTVDGYQQAVIHPVTLRILKKGYEVAMENDIQQFVAVTSLAMERLLKKIGIPMRRFGDQKPTRVGKVNSVACWIEVNEQYRKAVYTHKTISDTYQEVA